MNRRDISRHRVTVTMRLLAGLGLCAFAAAAAATRAAPAAGAGPNRCGTVSVPGEAIPLDPAGMNPARSTTGQAFHGSTIPLSGFASEAPDDLIAAGGQALALFVRGEKVTVSPVATTLSVHEAYGLSADRAWIAYRPLDGAFPSQDLYIEGLESGELLRVTDDLVLEAAWSPVDPDILAYAYTGGDRFGLAIIDVSTDTTLARIPREVYPDLIAWAPDGRGVYYLRARPYVQNIVDPSRRAVVEQVPYLLLSPGYVSLDGRVSRLDASDTLPPRFPRLDRPATAPFARSVMLGEEGLPPDIYAFRAFSPDYALEVLGDNLLGAGGVYVRDTNDGGLVLAVDGRLEAVLDAGLVIRTYSGDGSALEFHPWDNLEQGTSLARSASVTYMIPMVQAWVTQTAVGYEPDCYSTHTGTMSYAYDFAYGASGAHIMASADGTVAYVYSSVTCNSCDNTDCADYSSSCASNYGWGNVIILEHADATYTMYTHLAHGTLRVSTGDYACAGLHIADQGHTGCAMGSYCGDHLHFQRQNGPYTSSQSVYVTFSDANNPLTCGGYYESGLTEVSSCGSSSGDAVVVDDQDGGFTLYGPSEYWWEASAGYNNHMYYTYVNGNDRSNYARWRPTLSGSGDYNVFVYVPNVYATTQAAKYAIVHNRTVDYQTVNQNNYYNQWVSLGTYTFNGRGFEFVMLIDATGESPDTGRQIGFDAVKFVK